MALGWMSSEVRGKEANYFMKGFLCLGDGLVTWEEEEEYTGMCREGGDAVAAIINRPREVFEEGDGRRSEESGVAE
jgi:hypothetical protein